jgi:hypothetical protein
MYTCVYVYICVHVNPRRHHVAREERERMMCIYFESYVRMERVYEWYLFICCEVVSAAAKNVSRRLQALRHLQTVYVCVYIIAHYALCVYVC